ncbi:MAG: NAD kinase [Bacteroidia bacterium]|nr:NAD kinase [Bacteroidia bacterium]
MFNKLEELNIQVLVHDVFYNYSKHQLKFGASVKIFSKHEHIKGSANFLLSIGGDGTLLETISLVRDSVIPILGINTGRLGFLANVSKDEIETAVNALVNDKYQLDRRTLIRLETENNIFGDVNFALNEMTIHAREASVLTTIHTYINGEYLNSYWSDGLIIATPTGSTAYSLSCGGPIMIPDSQNFIITPIAPHNLNARPMVISDNDIVTLKVENRSNNFMVSLDSRSAIVDSSTTLTVKKEKFQINLVRMENQNFIQTLRNKLLWGYDKRN